MLNKIEQQILDFLDMGANHIAIIKISEILNICRPTTFKYIQRLEEKGFIKKTITPLKGGTSGDKTRETIIHKLKHFKG